MLARSVLVRNARLSDSISLCPRCLLRLVESPWLGSRRNFSGSSSRSKPSSSRAPRKQSVFARQYFSANASSVHGSGSTGCTPILEAAKAPRSSAEPPGSTADGPQAEQQHRPPIPPPNRRQRGRPAGAPDPLSDTIPLDASSRLAAISAGLPTRSLLRHLTTYLSLSKPRLSFLIVLSAAASYTLYPTPSLLLSTATGSPSLSALTLLFLSTSTFLCCASANALNMLLEPAHDAKMSRTRNRPLVRGLISPRGALVFAIASGALGVSGLYFGVNPTTAFLGGLNIALYAGAYTPLKRVSAVNTWVGAVVGAIPPLMGWAAAAGQSATGRGDWRELLLGEDNAGGWLLAALLFAWQFPHFNALSWTIRDEYRAAGHRMLCWTNARMNGRVALRYAVLMFPICLGLTWVGVTDRGFMATSAAVNAWMVREAWRFWRQEGRGGSARGLFWASVWHLPVIMVLAMVQKKGFWDGVWRRVSGEGEGEWHDELEGADGVPAAAAREPAAPV